MSAYISKKLRQRVRDQFRNRCAYCQTAEYLTVAIFEIEHIVPLSLGGQTRFENLCLACPTCNRFKSVFREATDQNSGSTVSLFHPQLEKWSEHFRWDESGTSIIGQTAVGRATIDKLKMNRPQLTRVRQMWVKLGEHP